MLDKQKHIDDAVKDKLDGFELSPPSEAWRAIQAGSSSTRKIGLWLFFSGLAVGIVILGVWYFTQTTTNGPGDKQGLAEGSSKLSKDIANEQVSQSDKVASTSDNSNVNNNQASENNVNAKRSEIEAYNSTPESSNISTPTHGVANSSSGNTSSSNTSNAGNSAASNRNSSSNSSSTNSSNNTGSSSSGERNSLAANNTSNTSNRNTSGFNASSQGATGTQGTSPNTSAVSQNQNGSNNSTGSNETEIGGNSTQNTTDNTSNAASASNNNTGLGTSVAETKSAMELIVLSALPIDLDLGDMPEHENNPMDSHGRIFPRWRAHAGIGLNSLKQQFDKTTANTSFGEGLEQNSNLSSGLNFEAGLAYYFTPGLFAETGYNFTSFGETYGFSYTDSITTYQIDTVGAYQDSATGDTIYITDSTAMSNYLSSIGYQENFYKIHSIPLMMGYTFQVGRRWNFDVSGGVNISVFSKFDGRAIQNAQYDLIDLESSHKKAGLLSARAMIRANYLFGEKHGVYLGASLSKHISSFNNSNLIYDRKLRFIGLSAGYRIIF